MSTFFPSIEDPDGSKTERVGSNDPRQSLCSDDLDNKQVWGLFMCIVCTYVTCVQVYVYVRMCVRGGVFV